MNIWKKLFGRKKEDTPSTLISAYAKGEIDVAEFHKRIKDMGIDDVQQLLQDEMAKILSDNITGKSRKKK
jgi:hypothetical protein